jgi:hypothetical protein
MCWPLSFSYKWERILRGWRNSNTDSNAQNCGFSAEDQAATVKGLHAGTDRCNTSPGFMKHSVMDQPRSPAKLQRSRLMNKCLSPCLARIGHKGVPFLQFPRVRPCRWSKVLRSIMNPQYRRTQGAARPARGAERVAHFDQRRDFAPGRLQEPGHKVAPKRFTTTAPVGLRPARPSGRRHTWGMRRLRERRRGPVWRERSTPKWAALPTQRLVYHEDALWACRHISFGISALGT